jgi:phage shock protein PspC (stress-responsive transcriptional regulator)
MPAPAASGDFSRLRRSRTDRWLGGAAAWRASGVDSWIWRLLFVLLSDLRLRLAIYILLWIFVPEDELIGN